MCVIEGALSRLKATDSIPFYFLILVNSASSSSNRSFQFRLQSSRWQRKFITIRDNVKEIDVSSMKSFSELSGFIFLLVLCIFVYRFESFCVKHGIAAVYREY